MTASKIVLGAASGAGGGAKVFVEDVFSTFLYEGNGSARSITNNIDLSNEGGLTWIKIRDGANSPLGHHLYDTARGATKKLRSDNTDAESTVSTGLTAFNSNGFSLGSNIGVNGSGTGDSYVSWTFRKAPKFFDIQTWSGDNSTNRSISHNIDGTVGAIFVKRTNGTDSWYCYHRGIGETKTVFLNQSLQAYTRSDWGDTAPTSSAFTVNGITNTTGYDYVAYIFGHNNNDGDYGESADQDIIKCGSYTGNSAGDPNTDQALTFGFEPSFIMIKKSSGTANWIVMDNMRAVTIDGNPDDSLAWNTSAEEQTDEIGHFTSTGFTLTGGNANNNGDTYIYMAIRRGPMATPETASSVFAIDTKTSSESTAPLLDASFAVDFAWWRGPTTSGTSFKVGSRLQGTKEFAANSNYREDNNPYVTWDHQNGIGTTGLVSNNSYGWMWARAPSYFDAVAYSGDGQSTHNITHNLGVAPEMIWIKRRGSGSAGNTDWSVYHKDVYGAGGVDGVLKINTSAAREDLGIFGTPSSTQFTVKTAFSTVNNSSGTYIAYLFATATGVSKVGSYTGNGGSAVQNIDCGFSNGAKLVLIKCATASGDWMVFDTSRGLVVGNDAELHFNDTDTQVSSTDQIDPLSSGFSIPTSADVHMNKNGETFIFYAVAA